MTNPLYMANSYQFESEAQIVSIGIDAKDGPFVVLDQTIFYPQGGGQPCDDGILMSKKSATAVIKVLKSDFEIRHFVESADGFVAGDAVKLLLNKSRRILNASLHTAGHLLCNLVEQLAPGTRGVKSYHFPEGPYVEFEGPVPDSGLLDKLTDVMMKDRAFNHHVAVSVKDGLRTVQIGSHSPTPCGGTHLKSIQEIAFIKAQKIKKTKGGFKISYAILDLPPSSFDAT